MRIGRYEVLGQLASGGMAEILLARLTGPSQFKRAVVIKRILRSFAGDEKFASMFLDEARIVASLRHPNVVHVEELGEHDGEAFLVMEYVAGENAASVLKRATKAGTPFDPRLVAHVIAELCGGIHSAHELTDDEGRPQNLVHRDVSPQNVMIGYDGHVKLVDFGVALFDRKGSNTQTGEMKGKVEYLSPEQASGKPLDRRSDVFSLGIVLYELSTGRRLFKRPTVLACMHAIVREPITPPSRAMPPGKSYPPKLDAIVMRALAKDPSDRYATAAEMRRELLEVAREVEAPVETLSDLMQALFADRISERRELLRKVSADEAIAPVEVPAGETDENVEVPIVETVIAVLAPAVSVPPPVPTPRSLPPTIVPSFAPPPPEVASEVATARAWRGAAIAIAVATVVSLVTVAIVLRSKAARPEEPREIEIVTAPAAVTHDGDAGTLAGEVIVHVESTPSGASVIIGGRDYGLTPLDLRAREGHAPVTFEIQRQGYVAATQTVVPDRDQKILVGLTPVVVHGRPAVRPPRPKAAPSASAGGFRRFD